MPSGTTRETCLRSRASTHASSSNSGISPAMCTGRSEGSKREMRFTPDLPARTGAAECFFANSIGADHAHSSDHDARNHASFVLQMKRPGVKLPECRAVNAAWHVARSGIIIADAAGPIYFGTVLPHQVQLLQLRL